jgi:hypothetical protein
MRSQGRYHITKIPKGVNKKDKTIQWTKETKDE